MGGDLVEVAPVYDLSGKGAKKGGGGHDSTRLLAMAQPASPKPWHPSRGPSHPRPLLLSHFTDRKAEAGERKRGAPPSPPLPHIKLSCGGKHPSRTGEASGGLAPPRPPLMTEARSVLCLTGNTGLLGANLLFEMLCTLPGVKRHPVPQKATQSE